MAKWRCRSCTSVYDEERGDPETGIAPGTAFSDLPGDWACPECNAGKGAFERNSEDPPDAATVSDVIIAELERWGVELAFGMPGESALPLVDALRRSRKIRYIVVRHEGNGAMAASAYNKLTGKIAVCLTIAGPGATHLATGLYDAKEDRASVLSINGQVKAQYVGPGGFQEIDQDAFFRPVTVFNNTVFDPAVATKIVTRALRHAIIERGVAQVSVPNNVQKMPVDAMVCEREACLSNRNIVPAAEEIEKAADEINRAERPVIVAGWGAMDAAGDVLHLARTIAAPIVITLRAKGILPDDNEWLVGIHGSLGSPQARRAVNDADLLIACGVGFSQQTALPADKPVVQIDIDPLQLGKQPFRAALWGNCRLVLPLLVERMRQRDGESMLQQIALMQRQWREQLEREADPDAVPIRPPYIMKILSETLPEDAVIAIDSGDNGWWFGRNFRMKRQKFTMSGYLGTMGYALPAALAAALAYPDRTAVAVVGDGGFQMVMGDFVTAVKYDLPIVVVLLNNRELAMIRVEQKMERYPPFGTDLLNPDFAAYAESCGGAGVRVERPENLKAAVLEAVRVNRPAIIDINTDPERFR